MNSVDPNAISPSFRKSTKAVLPFSRQGVILAMMVSPLQNFDPPANSANSGNAPSLRTHREDTPGQGGQKSQTCRGRDLPSHPPPDTHQANLVSRVKGLGEGCVPPHQGPQGQQRKLSQQLLCTGPSGCDPQSKLAPWPETRAGRSGFGREKPFSLSKEGDTNPNTAQQRPGTQVVFGLATSEGKTPQRSSAQ